MSKQLLMSQGEFTSWLRRLRMAVMGYVGLILLVGVVYIVAKLIGAEFGTLFVGVVGVIAGLALGAVAWGGLWLASLMHAQGEQLERQRERIALLESSLQMLEVEIEQKSAAPPPAPIVANTIREPSFPRIVTPVEPPVEPVSARPPEAPMAAEATMAPIEERLEAALAAGDLRAARDLWQRLDGGVPSAQRGEFKVRLDELAVRIAETLREEFAALVRAEQFSAALRKGEEIVALVPESGMSQEFATLRPHLEARAADSAQVPLD